MSAQHTPGPWDFTQDGSTAKKLATVCVTGDGWIVGVPFSRETDVNYEQHGTSKADARLIAAAPELLAALRKAEHIIEKLAGWSGNDLSELDSEFGYDAIPEAICKATQP